MKERTGDPRWVEVCRMWDELTRGQQQMVVLAMRAMTEKEDESQDVDANTPDEEG